MAGIRVIVCLPSDELSMGLEDAIARRLAPFERDSGIAWREIWDSWVIRGGSDVGGFLILPGHEDDARIIHDQPDYRGNPRPSLPGQCAGGPKGILGFAALDEWMPDLLTLDGWWIEDGNPIHSVCEDRESCSHMGTGGLYAKDPISYVKNLDPDVVLVRLRCHG